MTPTSIWQKKIPPRVIIPCSAVVIALVIAFSDWGYFFPRSQHPDIQFQILGESAEVMVFVLALVIQGARYIKSDCKTNVGPSRVERAIASGVFFGVCTLAFEWRKLFPSDQFQSTNMLAVVSHHLLMGLFFGLYSLATFPGSGKPSPEEEKSVV